MLGFDALGRLALGQLPGRSTLGVGTFVLSGTAQAFNVSMADAAGSFAYAGVAQLFAASLTPISGAFIEGGQPQVFAISEAAIAAIFSLSGQASTGLSGTLSASGTFVMTGRAAALTPSLNAFAGTYQIVGMDAHFARDFINWLPARPLGANPWGPDALPSMTRLVADTGQFFTTDAGLLGVGARRGPQAVPVWSSASAPSSLWTVDPAMTILPQVTN